MSRSIDLSPYEGRPDRPIWIVAAGITAILAALSIGSAGNYVSIVVAQATVSFTPTPSLTFQGTVSNGSLGPAGSLTISLGIRVDNPSSRTLHLQLLAFSEWVEDGPAEVGLNESRRLADARLMEANGIRYFFRVFGESREVAESPALPGTASAYTFSFLISHATDAVRFAALRNITDFGASTTGGISGLTWIFWVRVILVIDGVPPASSPTAAAYLRTIGRIDREEGLNLAG
jgi:hypothetical protein